MLKSKSVKVKMDKKAIVLHNMQSLKKLTDKTINNQCISINYPNHISEIVKISREKMNLSQIIFL